MNLQGLLVHFPDRSRHRRNLILTVCFIVCLPALWAGLMGDDFIHFALLADHPPIAKPNDLSLFGLFSFIDGDPERTRQLMDYSLVPWWTFAELKYAFWRPFSEFTHWIDHRLWPQSPWLMHLHSIAWYMAVLFLLSHLYSRMVSVAGAGLLALFIYGVDSSHGFAVGWISNRNSIIALCFAVIALISYISWRRFDKPRHLLLAAYTLALSLLSAEAGIAIFGYIAAYGLFLDKRGPVKGVLATLPLFGIIVIWWISYKYLGFGADHADAYYVDPGSHPMTYLAGVVERLPVMLASLWGIVPAELYGFSGQSNAYYVLFCALFAAACMAPVFLVLGLQKTTLFWFFGMLFSLFPVLVALPHDRLLLFAGIGAAALLAETLHFLFIRKACPLSAKANRYCAIVGRVLIVFHLILAPLLMPIMVFSPKVWADLVPTKPTYFDSVAEIGQKQLVLFATPMPSSVAIAPLRFYRGDALPKKVWTITTLDVPVEFNIKDLHTVQAVTEGGFIQGVETSFRDLELYPFQVGEQIKLNGLTITIIELNPEGHPKRINLKFQEALSSENLVFLRWNQQVKDYQPIVFDRSKRFSELFNKK